MEVGAEADIQLIEDTHMSGNEIYFIVQEVFRNKHCLILQKWPQNFKLDPQSCLINPINDNPVDQDGAKLISGDIPTFN